MGAAAYQLQTIALNKGLGREDRSAHVKVYEEGTKIEVKGKKE